jgi:hypothetical protein
MRDEAWIGLMFLSLPALGQPSPSTVRDFFQHRKQLWRRLHEKDGKRYEVLSDHNLAASLDTPANENARVRWALLSRGQRYLSKRAFPYVAQSHDLHGQARPGNAVCRPTPKTAHPRADT